MLKRGPNGSLVHLRDVGGAELGAEDYSVNLRFDGRDAVGIGVFQQPDANALDLEKRGARRADPSGARVPAVDEVRHRLQPDHARCASRSAR